MRLVFIEECGMCNIKRLSIFPPIKLYYVVDRSTNDTAWGARLEKTQNCDKN